MERLGFNLLAALLLLIGSSGAAWPDDYTDTIKIFREAGASSGFLDNSYGYAIFPTIGKAGVGIGGAYGKGRVYRKGAYVGDTSMKQLTVGWQLGGQGYSQIVFFQDQRAFDITAGASASANTAGSSTSASGGKHDATTAGSYNKGMATFTVAKGGLMFEASIGGQKFTYTPKKRT
jgi:lipid-binding SYLF domain-containing protein